MTITDVLQVGGWVVFLALNVWALWPLFNRRPERAARRREEYQRFTHAIDAHRFREEK